MEDRDILKKIVSEYDILNDARLFKALVSDYFYDKRVVKNLLCASYDEGIPHAIAKMSEYSKIDEGRFVKRLIDSYACDENKAKEVVSLWIYAYGVDPFSDLLSMINTMTKALEEYQDATESLKSNPIEVLEFEERINMLLHNSDIDTLRDLICCSRKQLMDIKGIGAKTCDNISMKLQDYSSWKLADESEEHFDIFYPYSLKKIVETKKYNWKWDFYVNSILKIYGWIDKFRNTYQAFAFDAIEKSINKRSSAEETLYILKTLICDIDIYNSGGALETFSESESINELLHYNESIYLFCKKIVMLEAEVKIVYTFSCHAEVFNIFLKLIDSIFITIDNHKKYLEMHKHMLTDSSVEVPIEQLPLRIKLDDDVQKDLESEVMKMVSRLGE